MLLFLRLCLAAVFTIAGISKIGDRAGTRQAVLDFNLPSALADPVAIGLPFLVIGIAILLLSNATAGWSSVAALALLVAFTIVIAASLANDRRPACHCYGQLRAQPIGS